MSSGALPPARALPPRSASRPQRSQSSTPTPSPPASSTPQPHYYFRTPSSLTLDLTASPPAGPRAATTPRGAPVPPPVEDLGLVSEESSAEVSEEANALSTSEMFPSPTGIPAARARPSKKRGRAGRDAKRGGVKRAAAEPGEDRVRPLFSTLPAFRFVSTPEPPRPIAKCRHVELVDWRSVLGEVARVPDGRFACESACGCSPRAHSQRGKRLCLGCAKIVCRLPAHTRAHFEEESHVSLPNVTLDLATGVCKCFACDAAPPPTKGFRHLEADGCAVLASSPLFNDLLSHLRRASDRRYGNKPGLMNQGNTCYMNAVLQSLFSSRAMTPPMLALDGGASSSRDSPLFFEMSNVWSRTHPVSRNSPDGPLVVDTSLLVSKIRTAIPVFQNLEQQDAHEFLRVFCDTLHREQAWTTDAFSGSLMSEVSCSRCGTVNRKIDECLDLSLEFCDADRGGKVLTLTRIEDGLYTPQPMRLADCLRRFARPEVLRGVDACESCSGRAAESEEDPGVVGSTVSRRLWFWKLPSVFVVHLKRFRFANDGVFHKVSRYVQFPLYGLDLGEIAAGRDKVRGANPPASPKDIKYDLAAVVVHHGRNFGNGHYTAYGKDDVTNRWYHYDDEKVTSVNEEVVARAEAYMLFYVEPSATRRRN